MTTSLKEEVEIWLDKFETLRPISAWELKELGYHKASTHLNITTYHKGSEYDKKIYKIYKMLREITDRPAKFCFMAPSSGEDAEDQVGVIVDKPFSYFESKE